MIYYLLQLNHQFKWKYQLLITIYYQVLKQISFFIQIRIMNDLLTFYYQLFKKIKLFIIN